MWIVGFLVLILNLLFSSKAMLKEISFKLVENCSIGTIVGNINLSAQLFVFSNVQLQLENSEDFKEHHSLSHNRFGRSLKNLFKINNSSGDLVTISEIDRETVCQLNLIKRNENCTILQIVSVNKLMWIYVNIEIIDINDNAPAFRQISLSISLSESSKVKSQINLEEPVDLDSDQFQPIQYRIQHLHKSNFPFSLSQNPLKLILERSVDYENKKHYQVVLIACDNGKPSLCGNQTVIINITNENDESPMFYRSNYTAIINEDTQIGEIVLSPKAFDKDDGKFGELEYSFSSGADEVKKYFSIDKKTGQISIIKRFNQPTKFKFSIKATDKAPNPLIGRTWIFLHVVDVNNHSPVILVNPIDSFLISKFQNHTVIEVSENNRIPFQLAFITVSDLDQGENSRCSCHIQSIINKDHLNYFKIINVIETNERSIYKLLADKSFDAEETKYFSLNILCYDHGEPQNSAITKIEIHIKDENEYQPTFDQNLYEIYIKENTSPETNVKTVKVYDRDLTQSRILDLTDPGSTWFSIDDSGTISTKIVLDYEKIKKLSFNVLAINRGIKSFTSSARVSVYVIDVNDNFPKFSLASKRFEVEENLKGFYEIGKIHAFDEDSEINSKLNYYLLNTTSENNARSINEKLFELNPTTGIIYSNVTLDYEECDLYSITVKVIDSGRPPLSNIQRFFIHVVDMNDNGPIWKYPNIHDNVMNISLQNIRDSVLTRVRAVDNDSDKYNVVHYFLHNHNDIFEINHLTGEITFKRLNIKPGQLTLQLQAIDANSKNIHTSQSLIVYIMGHDRSYLQFPLSSSLTFPVMISIIGISSLISIVLVVFVFYFCYRKRCMYRNSGHSAVTSNCRKNDKIKDIKNQKDSKKSYDIPLDLVTDNDAFNQNIIEDSMKLILDPLYCNSSSSSNAFHQNDQNSNLETLLCKLQVDNIYQDFIRHGYSENYNDPKKDQQMLPTISSIQTPLNTHSETCILHSMTNREISSHFDPCKNKSASKLKALDSNDSTFDTYATFLNCSCNNVVTSDYENSPPMSKVLTAPFIFNGSAWIPNTSLTNEKFSIPNKKDMSKHQPLKSIMKKTTASFINIDSSSSSGHCLDTDQASSTHDSGCIVAYTDSSLPPRSISLLDNTYQCKKSQV